MPRQRRHRPGVSEPWTATLLRDYIEYHLDQAGPSQCAPRFQVLAERFEDGLTLDAFYGTVDHV
jgi:hypothetical protein